MQSLSSLWWSWRERVCFWKVSCCWSLAHAHWCFKLHLEKDFLLTDKAALCCVSWLRIKSLRWYFSSWPRLSFSLYAGSLLQSVRCGPWRGSESRWAPWNGRGLAGGVEGQSHRHTPCKSTDTHRMNKYSGMDRWGRKGTKLPSSTRLSCWNIENCHLPHCSYLSPWNIMMYHNLGSGRYLKMKPV